MAWRGLGTGAMVDCGCKSSTSVIVLHTITQCLAFIVRAGIYSVPKLMVICSGSKHGVHHLSYAMMYKGLACLGAIS